MLTLPIKKKWYDMIISGEKKEEYRELTQYYKRRFKNLFDMHPYSFIPTGQDVKKIIFRNGYSNKSPSCVAEISLDIGTGKPEWGAEPGKDYYILKIHALRIREPTEEKKNE